GEFTYPVDGRGERNLETWFANIQRHAYYKNDFRNWPALLEPRHEKWQQLRATAKALWQEHRDIEEKLKGIQNEVSEAFMDAINPHIEQMREYLLSVYRAFCSEDYEVD